MKNRWGLLILVLLILAAALSLVLSKYGLCVHRQTLSLAGLKQPIRIVQLTDLHNSSFGTENRRLVEKVAAQEPDLILITGDLLDQNDIRTDIAQTLLRNLVPVAPVYVSFGNHETAHEKRFGTDLRACYTACGAEVLEYDWKELTLRGQTIRLGGISGYCLPEFYRKTGEARPEDCAFLKDFQATELPKLLMCHMPVCWIQNGSLDAWDVDVVLCGHAHGGQVRLPLIGGLWAPDQGWFQGRECGLYRSQNGAHAMVLSCGLGSTEKIPRFNNIPEILVLDLIP